MKNLYQSLLDDEDEVIDRMGNNIAANMIKPEYIKERSEHIMFLKIPKLKELYESGKLKYNNQLYAGPFDIQGIGFVFQNRRYFSKEMTKGYKGWSIKVFQFTSSFLSDYNRKYNTGYCYQNQILPYHINCKEAENIANEYMSVSKLSLEQMKRKCQSMLGKILFDEKLLIKTFEYCTEINKDENYINYKDTINKLLD